jgi:hypothetical protein
MGQIGVINLSSQILFKEIKYSSTIPTWLVVLIILKNMSSSMGRMTSHIWNIKFMFETTKATDFIHHFPSSAVFSQDLPGKLPAVGVASSRVGLLDTLLVGLLQFLPIFLRPVGQR